MKLLSPVRNEACKGKGFFAILNIVVLLGVILSAAISMGKLASAQTLESESPGSFVFDKSTDILESYSEIPSSDDSSTYIQYQYSSETIVTDLKNEIVELRSPNSRIIDENGIRHYIIYSGEQMILKEDMKWHNLDYATTTIEKFYTDIYYEKPVTKWKIIETANAQTYAGSGDGRVTGASSQTWSTAHDATTGGANYTDTDYTIGCFSFDGPGTYYQCARGFLPFDTSGLSDTQCFDTVDLVINADVITGGGTDVHVVQGTQASTNEVVNDDFDNYDSTPLLGNLAISTTGDKTISLTDFTGISTSSWTKLALLNDHDIDNSQPTGFDDDMVRFKSSETSGTTDDPYLDITMTDCPEEQTEEATSTIPFSVDGLNYSWDLTIIAGLTEHYESTTTAPDWVEVSYYHIPFFAWLIIAIALILIFYRLIIELLIRFRTK